MNKKGNLFYLIHSLNKSEKRYFKIFCFSQKLGKNYLRLFDAIVKQEVYDEAAIRKIFVQEKFSKQLHVTKNYLYQLILKSLRNFHHKSSPMAEVRSCIHHIELLFDRELYDHCHYEIKKAEKIAEKYELAIYLVEIAAWKRKLHLARQSRDPQLINPLIKQEAEAIQQLAQINQYWHFSTNIFDYINDTEGRLLKEDLFARSEAPTYLQGNTLHHHILYTYYVVNRKPQKAYEHILLQIEGLEKHPNLVQQNPSLYISALNNQVSFLIQHQRHEEAIPLLEKIRGIAQQHSGKSQKLTVRTQLRAYNVELEVYRDTRDTSRGLQLQKEVVQFLETHRSSIPQEYYLLLWYQFAHLYFLEGQLMQSLHWVNAINNTRFPSRRGDLERYARILNLIIHLELGNNMVLRYSVDNSRRFLKKQNKIQPFEKVLLSFFSKASKSPKAQIAVLKQKLFRDLFEGRPPLVNDNILDYFDFSDWLKK